MRTIVTLFMLVLSLCLSACHNDAAMIDSTGQPVNLKTHPRHWLIINYWAPWCSHCRAEIAEFNVFYQTHRQTVLVYGVDYDAIPLEKLLAEAKRLGIDYPLLPTNPAKLLNLAPIDSLPVTFVYAPNGQLVRTLQGPQTHLTLEAAISNDEPVPS